MFQFFNQATKPVATDFSLHQAVRDGNVAQVIQLIASGCPLEQEDAEGQTPLYIAVFGQKLDVMQALLERGANPNASSSDDQQTPLHVAAAFGNPKVIEMLLQAGANPNAVDETGDTPLRMALLFNHEDVAKMLLLGGANPYLTDGEGNTALHMAVNRGCDATVRFLAEQGMNLGVRNHKNLTPIELAINQCSSSSVRILAEFHTLSDLEYLQASLAQANPFRMQGVNHALSTVITQRRAQQAATPGVLSMPR